MEITACPKCGSQRIFQGRLKEGVLTGYTSREVCRNCGYQGSPFIFDHEEDYKNFLEQLKKEGKVVEKPKILEKKSEIVKTSYKSIGFVFFIIILLVAIGLIASLIIFTGILIIVGIILFIALFIVIISITYSRHLFGK
jgi:uncharacterized membrane protein YkgB